MKRVVFAIYAVVFSFAAHAVTVNWDEDVNWGDMRWRGLNNLEDGERDISHIKDTAKAAYRVNIGFSNGVPTSGCVLMLGGICGVKGGYGITLAATENGLVASLKDENHTATFQGTATLKTGVNQLVLAIDRNGWETNYKADISIFVNGEECLTYTGRMAGVTFDKITIGRGYEAGDNPMSLEGVIWSGAIVSSANVDDHYTGLQDIRDAYALLPEPTILALLAFGVAGWVLRRKTA